MRRRTATRSAAVLAGALALTLVAGPAWAVDPVDAGGKSVVDEAGVLSSSEEQQAESAISSLASSTGAHVTAVLVGTFTDPTDGKSWARATGNASGLGSGDLVLAIAVTSRQVYWLPNSDFPIDESTVDWVGDDDLKPHLTSGDWSGGIVAFANGLKAAGASSGTASGSSSSGASALGGLLTLLLVLILVAVVVVVVVVLVRRRRRTTAGAGAGGGAAPPVAATAPAEDQAELDRRASRGLVELDDALRTSDQELGFAQAEFGDDAVRPFAAALDDAKAHAAEAFGIRQQLDDDRPETPDQRRAMTTRIVTLVDAAQRGLAEQQAAFDDLRGLERRLPDALAAATADHDRLAASAERAGAMLQTLAAQHGEATVHGALDDLGQAHDLLGFAKGAIDRAARGGAGAVAVRGAQQALGQAERLLAGVSGTPDELLAAKRRLDAALDDGRRDLDDARRLAATAGADRQALDAAARDLDTAVRAADDDAPSVALAAVERADRALDVVLGRVRDRDAQASHARDALPRALDAARRGVDAAADFVDTRRGGVGPEARTRLAEAQRLLAQATAAQASDPVAALGDAQRAQQLADQAVQLARDDVDDFRSNGPFGGGGGWGGYGGGWGGGRGSGVGGVIAGAALGGILGGILNGDRGYGGGWGGGGWGADAGGGFDGGSWGGDSGGFGDGGGSWGDGGGGGFGGGDSGGGGNF